MNSVLAELEPKAVWKHFDALCSIPRASTKEAEARNYVLAIANRLELESVHDAVGNTVIRKPARRGRENSPITALQSHLDMVCEKDEGTAHDFSKDAIRVRRDGDWLKAEGTTLGSDNGIGVAAALAVMESDTLAHGPLELVFTIDEETGLTGAAQFPPGLLKSRFMLNLDNEETGTLCIGCSGGINTTAIRHIQPQPATGGAACRIKVSGLQGGHSGVDIHLGRGNALRILGRALQRLMSQAPVEIADLKGGSARNAIPREAAAIVLVEGADANARLKSLIAEFESEIRADLGAFDAGVQISVEPAERPLQALPPDDARRAIDLLAGLPHGVLAMSPDVPGLVQNSTNLATVAVRDGRIEIGSSQRSAIESSKIAAATMVATICRLAGFEVEHSGSYPGWKPEPSSELVQKLKTVHERVFGASPRLIAMHAGLECGVIGEKYPEMQKISFGPQIENPHSPHERVQISTVSKFWDYLQAVLEEI